MNTSWEAAFFSDRTEFPGVDSSPEIQRPQSNKLTLYKLLIRPIVTSAAPVCSSSYSSNYLKLPVIQSKCLRVIGNFHRLTPTSHLHDTLNIEPIRFIIHRLAAKCFNHPSHPNPLAQQIGNYILDDRTAVYKK